MACAQGWDERYRSGSHTTSEPDPFLLELESYRVLLRGSHALDLACGAGRHSLALARAGFAVTGIDFSQQGLAIAAERTNGLGVRFINRDLESSAPEPENEAYDLVVVFDYLYRPLFEPIRRCLRPSGLVLYKTYMVGSDSGPSNPNYLLRSNELLGHFEGFRVLRYQEWLAHQPDGRSSAAIIAQKPE